MLATDDENSGVLFHDDAEAVSFAAGLLDISEYRLFEIAYEDWFGSRAAKSAMDGFFGSYLKSEPIPFWLRNLVRTIISRHRQGNLSPHRFGIDPPCLSRSKRRLGWILVGLFHCLVFAVVWGSATYTPY